MFKYPKLLIISLIFSLVPIIVPISLNFILNKLLMLWHRSVNYQMYFGLIIAWSTIFIIWLLVDILTHNIKTSIVTLKLRHDYRLKSDKDIQNSVNKISLVRKNNEIKCLIIVGVGTNVPKIKKHFADFKQSLEKYFKDDNVTQKSEPNSNNMIFIIKKGV